MTTGRECTPNAGLSKSKFTSGKKHRLGLINGAAEGLQRFTIDGHNMTVMANDFVPVVPYETNMVTLGIGQRTDVIVEANGPHNSSSWIRADIPGPCSVSNQLPFHALAVIYYANAVATTVPNTMSTPYNALLCNNDPLNKATRFFSFPATSNPAVTQKIDMTIGPNLTG
jgi:FtsP/CotA-like multicopper oxidase with cupredoxin domain